MTTSPFVQMACALTLHAPIDWKAVQEEIPDGLTRTERIRRLLKAAGRPVTAHEITWDMADHFPDFGSHLVWLLMKYEMEKGRVIFDKSRHTYAWNHEYETAEAMAIRAAQQLLKKHGYTVKAPKQ